MYKNGKEILPADLLNELQKYVQGEIIYIPKKEAIRASWGAVNGTRNSISMRNQEICKLYHQGLTMMELTHRFHLSEDSIKKIIRDTKNKNIC